MGLKVEQTSFGGSTGTVTAAPTWNSCEQSLVFEGSHKGGSNRLYMYSFNGQPPYPVPENIFRVICHYHSVQMERNFSS